jgi:O-antigen ligase
MPLVRDLVGSSVVASPSVLLLALLFAGWLIPFIVRGGRLPLQTVPLLAFISVVLLSFGAALALSIPALKDLNPFSHSIIALITLGIGVCTFLLPGLMIRDERSFKFTLQCINVGGFLILAWSLFQAAVWFGQGHYWNWMRDFQDLVSLGPLYRGRAAGFALEPSWLAHQLNMLYLPLWVASTVQRYSAYRLRLFGLSIENLLAAGGCVTLALTFSRVGWLGFFFTLTYLFILANIRLVKWLGRKISAGRVFSTGVIALLIVLYLGAATGAVYIMSRVDPRMKNLFTAEFWQQDTAVVLANQLQFGERVVYWQAGWDVFNQHPLLGVGPGNAGFYFSETMPSFGWKLVEVRQLMYRAGDIPNSKNLWVRLLAENGIVGMAAFLGFLASIFLAGKFLLHQSSRSAKMIGMMGVFVIIALAAEGFSIDSFALPYYWISFGMVSAVGSLAAGGHFAEPAAANRAEDVSANHGRGDN